MLLTSSSVYFPSAQDSSKLILHIVPEHVLLRAPDYKLLITQVASLYFRTEYKLHYLASNKLRGEWNEELSILTATGLYEVKGKIQGMV